MKLIHCLALFIALAFLSLSATAQVTNFGIFKVTVYHQTNSAQPVAPDFPKAYYFGAQVNLTSPYYYSYADFYTPMSMGYPDYMYYSSADNLYYGSPYYSSKSA